MAKFYLNEFRSKTPAAAGSPQGAEVPVGPYKRSGEPVKVTPAKYFGVDARVQNIDIQKNIPSLMQGKLPDKLSNALVGGQLERGQAWAGAAESLGNLASTIGNIAGKLQYSKDLADKSRYKNLIQLSNAAFEEEAAEKNLNGMQQMELAKSYHEKLDADIGSLGLSRDNLDQAGVDTQLYKAKHRTELTHKMREEQMKSDAAAIETRMTQAVNAGDPEGAMDALEDALQAQLINKGQYDKKKQELYIAFDERNAQEDIGSNPRAALEILENDVRTGKSDAYPSLNPGQRKELRDQAKSEVTRREMETKETILNGIADGTLKTPENIDDAAGGNLGANDVAALKARQAEPGPEYSPESYSKIELAIDNYVKEDLTTGATEYHRILDMIAEGAPKKEQADLIDRLQKKRDKQKDNLPGKDWFPELLNEFTNMTEDGRFIPKVSSWTGPAAAFDVKDMKDPKWRLEHKAELDAMWDRSRSMQILMRKWRAEHPGDDEQTIKDARKYQNELLNLDSSQAGQEAIRKQLQIQLPTTGVMGTRDTGITAPREPLYVIGLKPTGMIEQGNIDLNSRPIIKNPDGTISSERSFSISDESGNEILIPLVVNGKEVTQKEAVEHYYKTGEHMGKFKDAESADAYAEKAHNRPMPATSSIGGTLNESLISTVKQLEGFNPNAYWDSGQYSIGYGTRGRKGESLTQPEADARLAQELSVHASNVDRAAQQVGLQLTEGQRNALISFDFNTGAAERLITSSNGNIAEIRRRMPSWNKEDKGGPVSKGLVNRRRAELAMFNA